MFDREDLQARGYVDVEDLRALLSVIERLITKTEPMTEEVFDEIFGEWFGEDFLPALWRIRHITEQSSRYSQKVVLSDG